MLLLALALIPVLPAALAPAGPGAAGAPAPALYGPAAICHPLRIGEARSLPWKDVEQLTGIDPEFKLADLAEQTAEILAACDDSIVHMETLRRATLYLAPMQKKFDKQQRRKAQAELELKLQEALRETVAMRKDGRGNDRREALILFDIAYLRGAMEQISIAAEPDFRTPLEQALKLQPKDVGMHLGACLIQSRGSSRQWKYLDTALRLAQDPSRDLRWNFINTAGVLHGISDFEELAMKARSKAGSR